MCGWSWGGIRRCPSSVTNPTICYGVSDSKRRVGWRWWKIFLIYIFNILPCLSLKYSRESRDQAERKKKKTEKKIGKSTNDFSFYFLFRDSLDLPHLTHSSSHLVEPIITGSSRSICCTAHIHSSHHKSEGKRDVIKHQSHGDAHLFFKYVGRIEDEQQTQQQQQLLLDTDEKVQQHILPYRKGPTFNCSRRSLYINRVEQIYTTISYWCSLIHRSAACSSKTH